MRICSESKTQHFFRFVDDAPRSARSPFLAGWWVFSLTLLALVSLLGTGCERCSSGPAPLATLVEKKGPVDRDTATEQERWVTAEKGSEFDVGDAVFTRADAEARLHLDDGSVLGLEQETMVRFLDKEPGQEEQALDLVMGEASLLAPAEGVNLRTAFGLARLEGGTRVRLTRSEESLELRVLLGTAQVEKNDGKVVDVAEGESVVAVLGEAEIEAPDEGLEPPEPSEPSGPIQADVRGKTVRIRGPGQDAPEQVGAGNRPVAYGSLVEVGRGSSVLLTRADQTAELSPGTYLVGTDEQLVQSQGGSFTVSSEKTIRIQVPGGTITTTGGRATITPEGEKGTRVEAHSGVVRLDGKGRVELKGGEEGILASDGTISTPGRGLSHADIEVAAGQSIVIHDPRPPTAVGFVFGKHCDRGKVELKGAKSALPGDSSGAADERVNLLVGGRTEYTLRCLDDTGALGPVVSQGKVTVLADAGTRPVPKNAPSTSIDVNGRSYTVLYQNLLPRVTVRWKGAPEAAGFRLKLQSGGRTKTLNAGSAAYTFSPGALREGTHSVYFEGGGRISRRSTISIRFDNAAPTASLQTPAGTGVGPGGRLNMVGTALPGWTVTVDGKPVGQDAEGRFSVPTVMPSSGRPIAVVLSHPSRGSHVYLRRPAGAK